MKTGRKRLWGWGLRSQTRSRICCYYRERPITELALKCVLNEFQRAKRKCTKRLF